MEWKMGEYLLSDNGEKIDINKVHCMLSKTYWADHRLKETVHESIKNSLCFGIYLHKEQVGFARVITDRVLFSWICDVVIDESFRGNGLGKWLIQCIIEHPAIRNTAQSLATGDAHGLYEKYGFKRTETMKRIPQEQLYIASQ